MPPARKCRDGPVLFHEVSFFRQPCRCGSLQVPLLLLVANPSWAATSRPLLSGSRYPRGDAEATDHGRTRRGATGGPAEERCSWWSASHAPGLSRVRRPLMRLMMRKKVAPLRPVSAVQRRTFSSQGSDPASIRAAVASCSFPRAWPRRPKGRRVFRGPGAGASVATNQAFSPSVIWTEEHLVRC